MTWIIAHHPRTEKNDALQHNIGNERLVANGYWETMNLGYYLGQRLALEDRKQDTPTMLGRYAFDLATAAQDRGRIPAARIRKVAYESARVMHSTVLAHIMVVPDWKGIWLGNGVAGLTDAEIADRYPAFARQWQAWSEDMQPMPPNLPGRDSETTTHFVQRVLRGIDYILRHRQSDFVVTIMSRSVLQVVHATLQGYDLAERIPCINPPYGAAEEWRLSAGPPENISGRFMKAAALAKLLQP